MKWYAFNDKGVNYQKLSLILDHNTTTFTTWLSRENVLKNDTSSWDSSINSRIITVDKIATITGNQTFKTSTASADNWFYFNSNNQLLGLLIMDVE